MAEASTAEELRPRPLAAPRDEYLKLWDPEEFQLVEEQGTGVGGSEVALLCGLGYKGKNALDLYYKKTRPLPLEPEPPNFHMRRGVVLEPLAADRYEAETGRRVHRIGVRRMRGAPHRLAHLDRKVVGLREGAEFKAPGKESMLWMVQHGIRESYLLQGQWQCAVTGYTSVDFGLLSLELEQDWLSFPVPADRELIGILIERVDRFWLEHVIPGIEPDPTDECWAPLDRLPAGMLEPFIEKGKRPVLEVDPNTSDVDLVANRRLLEEALDRREDRKEAESLEAAAKGRLRESMEFLEAQRDVDGVKHPEVGTTYHRWQNGSPNVSPKRLRAAAPLSRDAVLRWLATHTQAHASPEEAEGYVKALAHLQEEAMTGALDLDLDAFISVPRFQSLRMFKARTKPEEGAAT